MQQVKPDVMLPPWKKGQCELWSVVVAQEDVRAFMKEKQDL